MGDRRYIEEIEELAALFALGALPADEAKKFGQRLEAECPFCRAEVRGCGQAMAALAMNVPQVAPPAEARQRLLKAIGAKPEAATTREAPGTMGPGIIVRKDDTGFEATPVPGVEYRSLMGRDTVLLRMAPKSYYPAHQHHAGEQCLVLEGSVSSDGVTAYAGDFTYMPKGSSHDPLYSETGCLLLIAYT